MATDHNCNGVGCSHCPDSPDLHVYWTPRCGALHAETNPKSIGLECPDGLGPDWGRNGD